MFDTTINPQKALGNDAYESNKAFLYFFKWAEIPDQVSLNGVCWGSQGGRTPKPMKHSGYNVCQVLAAVMISEKSNCTSGNSCWRMRCKSSIRIVNKLFLLLVLLAKMTIAVTISHASA